MRRSFPLLAVLALCALALAVGPPAAAVDNDLDLHGFTPPVLVPLTDASIAVGDAVWRSGDGLVYVVNTKTASLANLVDVKAAGFRVVVVTPAAEKVVRLAHITIDVPGAAPPPAPPSTTASAP